MSPLEKAAQAAYDSMVAEANLDAAPWKDQPDQGIFRALARAVLLAVKVDEPVYMNEQRFNDRIDAILEGE